MQDRPFYIDYQGSQATVYWQKRNEMRIEKGAKLAEEIPYNKDGSLGFSARLEKKSAKIIKQRLRIIAR